MEERSPCRSNVGALCGLLFRKPLAVYLCSRVADILVRAEGEWKQKHVRGSLPSENASRLPLFVSPKSKGAMYIPPEASEGQ